MSIAEALDAVAGLFQQYGLIALLAVCLLEGAMVLYFAPSESLVPGAIILLADSPADVGLVVGVAVLGTTVGQTALFVLARRGGREYLLTKGWFRIEADRLDRFDAWFARWGPIAVPASNTLLFVRGLLTVPAGVSDMSVRRFVVLSTLGTVSFQIILAAVTVYAPDLLAGFV